MYSELHAKQKLTFRVVKLRRYKYLIVDNYVTVSLEKNVVVGKKNTLLCLNFQVKCNYINKWIFIFAMEIGSFGAGASSEFIYIEEL